jgi:hypothetical protein
MIKIKSIKYQGLGEERKPSRSVGKPVKIIKSCGGRPPAKYDNPSHEDILRKYLDEPDQNVVGRKRKQ